jgi:acyl carrier protein
MTKKEIEEKLIDGISGILSLERSSVDADVPFKELGLDSLGFVEMLVFIEKTFNLNMVETDLTKKDFETLNSLATFLSNKL